MKMFRDTSQQLEESYQHIKPYLHDTYLRDKCCEELKEMCSQYECYCGNEHDYEECRKKPCFNFYLAFKYLEWANSYHNNEKVEI